MPFERFRAIPVVMLAAAVSLYAADKPKSAKPRQLPILTLKSSRPRNRWT